MAVLKCTISGTIFDSFASIIPSTSLTIDDVVSNGIFRFTLGRLSCPFIWLYILASRSNYPLLRQLLHIGIASTPYFFHPRPLPGSRLWWQDWELFTAQFRVLKDDALRDCTVSYAALHHGAFWRANSLPSFDVVCSLKSVEVSSKQLDTKCIPAEVRCEHGNFNPRDGQQVILNAASSPAGDAFCFLNLAADGTRAEIHQCKLHGSPAALTLSADMMEEEREKAATPDALFLIFSTFDSVEMANIPPNTGVVCKANFDAYFGSFAGRAFFLANLPRISVATASRSLLQTMDGIGEARADAIIQARLHRAFTDIDDCQKRTKIPKSVLDKFAW